MSTNAKPGWFSRRYPTNEGLTAYRAEKEQRIREQEAACKARIEAAAKRTPEEQIARLDALFGKNQGAKKERAKLAKRIEARKNAPEQDTKPAKKAKKKAKKS